MIGYITNGYYKVMLKHVTIKRFEKEIKEKENLLGIPSIFTDDGRFFPLMSEECIKNFTLVIGPVFLKTVK